MTHSTQTVRPTLLLAACLFFTAISATAATINKCTDANGRVAFSDLPCEMSDTNTGTKTPSGAAPASGATLSGKNLSIPNGTDRASLEKNAAFAALSPMCKDIYSKMVSIAVANDQSIRDTFSALSKRWYAECNGGRSIDPKDFESIAKSVDASIIAEASCKDKREIAADRRAKIQDLNEAGRSLLAALEKNIAQQCK